MKKKLIAIIIAVILVAAVAVGAVFSIKQSSQATEISIEEAQKLVNTTFDEMAKTKPLKAIADANSITVNDMTYGLEKDIILECTVNTLDAYSAIAPHYNEFLRSDVKKMGGAMFKSALDFKMEFEEKLADLVSEAETVETECTIVFYEVDSVPTLYAANEVVDTVYGGVVKVRDEISEKKTYTVEGSDVEREIETNNVNKGFNQCLEMRYNSDKPDTSSPIIRAWNDLKADFHKNFIEHDRWLTILNGLWTTIRLTIFALLIGIVLGFIVAFVRCTYDKLDKKGPLLKFFNWICNIYLTITRGTPVVVQIMIIYFVIFMPIGLNKFLSAVICFGLNSGAYVAEIVRGGIMSIDDGQTEAGRSLGFGYMPTMFHIVFPQAFKAVLPALANEFVVLLKETSIAFYIGLGDLMYAGNAIRAATYSAFMPLVTVAVIYLVMVLALSKLVSLLEKRLRNNER